MGAMPNKEQLKPLSPREILIKRDNDRLESVEAEI